MKAALILVMFLPVCLMGQPVQSNYDKKLADSLGADENGMKSYVFVILKTGKAKIEDKAVRDSLFKGHFDNISKLSKSGQLIVAGPFHKNDLTYRGLFIMNVKTPEEAKALLQNDPTISSGIFDLEVLTWYGSAALPFYLPVHDKIQKNKP